MPRFVGLANDNKLTLQPTTNFVPELIEQSDTRTLASSNLQLSLSSVGNGASSAPSHAALSND